MSIQYEVYSLKLIIIYVGRTFKMEFVETRILTYISYLSTHVLYNGVNSFVMHITLKLIIIANTRNWLLKSSMGIYSPCNVMFNRRDQRFAVCSTLYCRAKVCSLSTVLHFMWCGLAPLTRT